MIHLDTNILIEIVTLGSPMANRLAEWLKTGEQLATSSIAWSEFLSGPVSENQIDGVRRVLVDQIVHFGVAEAAAAAHLFNQVGRRRSSRVDSFIAASAMLAGAPLLTKNLADFRIFEPFGLRLQR
jgi:predicted nucleic acid-binding protein